MPYFKDQSGVIRHGHSSAFPGHSVMESVEILYVCVSVNGVKRGSTMEFLSLEFLNV